MGGLSRSQALRLALPLFAGWQTGRELRSISFPGTRGLPRRPRSCAGTREPEPANKRGLVVGVFNHSVEVFPHRAEVSLVDLDQRVRDALPDTFLDRSRRQVSTIELDAGPAPRPAFDLDASPGALCAFAVAERPGAAVLVCQVRSRA
jgi:hypothetical protein